MLMFAIVITLCSKDWSASLWHHVKMLHTRCHVTGCTKVRKTYIATVRAPIFMWPVVPWVWWIRPWNSYQTPLGSKYWSHTMYLTFLSHKTLPKQTSYSENPLRWNLLYFQPWTLTHSDAKILSYFYGHFTLFKHFHLKPKNPIFYPRDYFPNLACYFTIHLHFPQVCR